MTHIWHEKRDEHKTKRIVNEGQTEVVIYDLAQKRGTTNQNTKLKE